jgi:hypothetical protein
MENNDYEKETGNRELKKVLKKREVVQVIQKKPNNYNNLPVDYIKNDGSFDPSLFIIISGGTVREKNYFASFKLKNRENNESIFPRIQIEFICENDEGIGGFNVNQLVDQGIEVKKKYDETKSDDLKDNIYLVTDVDEFREQLINRKDDCIQNDLKLIISNPCFEIWLYYSYFQDKPIDFKIPEKASKISESFKTYVGEKKEGGIDPRKAPFEILSGTNSSKNHFSSDDDGIPHLFSTNMFELAKEILPLVDVEILAEKERRELKANHYRKI